MVALIKQQFSFLKLFVQTTTPQRKVLLKTITRNQLRALSQIAHNIIKFKIKLSFSEKQRLKRERRIIHLLGDRKLGYKRKKEAIQNKQRLIFTLLNIAVTYLEPHLK
jgi:hypothetical protein